MRVSVLSVLIFAVCAEHHWPVYDSSRFVNWEEKQACSGVINFNSNSGGSKKECLNKCKSWNTNDQQWGGCCFLNSETDRCEFASGNGATQSATGKRRTTILIRGSKVSTTKTPTKFPTTKRPTSPTKLPTSPTKFPTKIPTRGDSWQRRGNTHSMCSTGSTGYRDVGDKTSETACQSACKLAGRPWSQFMMVPGISSYLCVCYSTCNIGTSTSSTSYFLSENTWVDPATSASNLRIATASSDEEFDDQGPEVVFSEVCVDKQGKLCTPGPSANRRLMFGGSGRDCVCV